ncbi:YozE family protein [Pisciglobus halotolerans]|uniref:UPF0346 protein SAMN04489868_10584 n=1 Tax=Pisciglobus halotolerans TaxID=745365 RepID=A0A1I3BC15_9LACT|nr:YozE family protein [Pisciglobus halotolerans]SFH59824.1 Uncharacterized protein YozE, UPF0346 family [Pisciglobus halotolerans]
MKRSFYHYLMTERDPHKKDAVTLFANDAYLDDSFPKQSENYQEISQYLELNGSYLSSMTIFDEAWERYQQQEI